MESQNDPLSPLYEEREFITEALKEARNLGDEGSIAFNQRLDLLEERLTEVSTRIAKGLGIPDPRGQNPLWKDWDEAWKRLKTAKYEGRDDDEQTAWGELEEIWERIRGNE